MSMGLTYPSGVTALTTRCRFESYLSQWAASLFNTYNISNVDVTVNKICWTFIMFNRMKYILYKLLLRFYI